MIILQLNNKKEVWIIKTRYIVIFLVVIFILVTSCVLLQTNCVKQKKLKFKSSMNIGNALEAPKGMFWGVQMKLEYFDDIKKAGFDSVRLPVRFSDYAKNSPNYTLDEDFMKQVDSYINYALKDKLVVILDFHHFEDIMEEPEKYKKCFISIWKQLSERYKDYPPELIFELLNEPKSNLKGETWNEFIRDGVAEIRKNDKDRTIIVGPDNYYSVYRLEALSIPNDENIAVSFHYYEPNNFTFQGNQYHPGFENLKDIKWTGSEEEINYLKSRFDIAKKWGEKHNVEIFLGEFGANQNAPIADRKRWTEAVRKEAENCGFSFGYWELCSWFGIYDANSGKWDKDILDVLLPNK